MILLAKYRGPYQDTPDKPIEFNERVDRLSWLKAFGTAINKETHRQTFVDCFGQINFITGNRGGGHNHPKPRDNKTSFGWAKYHPARLRLHNVHVYMTDGFTKTGNDREANEKDLVELAKTLEKGRIRKGKKKWKMVVTDMIFDLNKEKAAQNIDSSRKNSLAVNNRKKSITKTSKDDSCIVYKNHDEIISKAVATIEKQEGKGFWYYIGPGIGHSPKFANLLSKLFRAINQETLRNKSSAFMMVNYYASESYRMMRSHFESMAARFSFREPFDNCIHFCEAIKNDDETIAILFTPEEIKTVTQQTTAPAGTWLALGTELFWYGYSGCPGHNEFLFISGASDFLNAYYRTFSKIVLQYYETVPDNSPYAQTYIPKSLKDRKEKNLKLFDTDGG